MAPGILGKKIGMTQIFDGQGRVIPVTVVQAGPCVVVQRKTVEKDGYSAIQLGLVEFIKESRVTKPRLGHFKKAGVEAARYVREFPVGGDAELNAGDRVLATEFKPNDRVDITAKPKGRGFQGVVKRHGFSGGPESHGSMTHRAPGSIGQSSYPSRVIKGVRMGGRMGGTKVTTIGLQVVEVLEEDNVILVRGAVPGPNGGYVMVRRSQKQ
jgi:large subunit ribosomal protein L3